MKYSIKYDTMPTRDGRVSVRMRVSWCSLRVSANIAIADPAKLDASTMRSKEVKVSKAMSLAEGRVATLFAEADITGAPPVKSEVLNAIRGRVERVSAVTPMVEYIAQFIAQEGRRNDWAFSTIKRWTSIRNALLSFNPNLTFADLNEQTIARLIDHLERLGHRNTTIKKELAMIRWFVNWAVREGVCEELQPTLLRPKVKSATQAKQVIYLDWDEVLSLLDLELGRGYALVRDIFVFQCATGLRWSDATKLRHADIYDHALHIVTTKTSDALTIELNDLAESILARYDGDGVVFPRISAQKANDYIKEICRWADIITPITQVYFRGSHRIEETLPKCELVTTHCGRRSFVVHALRLGIPAEVIMRWTGHSDFNAMKPYIAIVDELKRESMAKFNEKTPKK